MPYFTIVATGAHRIRQAVRVGLDESRKRSLPTKHEEMRRD
jgi:hypothetical protein